MVVSLIWPLTTQAQQNISAQQRDNIIEYRVQSGDTLLKIALTYQISLEKIVGYNRLTNPNLIIVGQKLLIPLEPELGPVLRDDEAGENSPLAEAIANITTPDGGNPHLPPTYVVKPGDTLFAIALELDIDMDELAAANGLVDVNVLQVGQVLTVPNAVPLQDLPLVLPFLSIVFSEKYIAQGRTLAVSITLTSPATVTAFIKNVQDLTNQVNRPVVLSGQPHHNNEVDHHGSRQYWGLVGLHALSEIGVYDLEFVAVWASGAVATVTQQILVTNGSYRSETIQVIAGRENLLAPEVIANEFAKLSNIWSQVTVQPLWQGTFDYPVSDTRVTSSFGTRRVYVGGTPASYHAGTDFGGGVGTPVYAPAHGIVVLAELLQVRGNAILIDHGLGLYSGYWHLSEFFVQPGAEVQPGTLIGHIGNTGLVTGPHLHWEMRLGGIAVDPLQWIETEIP